jgi:hypothetical protein
MLSEKWWAVIGIVGCLVSTFLLWSTKEILSKFCKSDEIVVVGEKEVSNPISVSKTVPTIDEKGHFLPDTENVVEIPTTRGLQNSLEESRYLSQTSRDLSWLDTWQTKTHRRSEFAKSMMALILPTQTEVEGTYEGASMGVATGVENHDESAGEKEMLVVPANMTTGMCDHNLAMGLFLWSPSKSKSKGTVEGQARSVTASLGSSNQTYEESKVKPCAAQKLDSLNTFTQCACSVKHTPLSPITDPSSATMSALSSAKSSRSVICGPSPGPGLGPGPRYGAVRMPHHDVRNRTPHKREIHSELREMFADYAATPSSLSSNLSSSAAALSPPPPSSASSMSPQLSNKAFNIDSRFTWEQTHRTVYPLRYHHQHQLRPVDPSKPFRMSALMTDNAYLPFTREDVKPCISPLSLVGERKDSLVTRSVFTADSLPRRAARCTAPYE